MGNRPRLEDSFRRVAGVTNAFDYRSARGLCAFDVHHRVVLSAVYELPFGKGRKCVNAGPLARIIGDWQLSTLFQWQTGSPLTLPLSGNPSNRAAALAFSTLPRLRATVENGRRCTYRTDF